MSNPKSTGVFGFVVVLFGFALILQLLGRVSGSGSTAAPEPSRSTFEHRYATERLRQEGYSNTEAQQAADAIIKFHNAQQNRSR
jgi:hypothetical protein